MGDHAELNKLFAQLEATALKHASLVMYKGQQYRYIRDLPNNMVLIKHPETDAEKRVPEDEVEDYMGSLKKKFQTQYGLASRKA